MFAFDMEIRSKSEGVFWFLSLDRPPNFLDLFYPPLGLINGSHSRLTKNPTARYTKGE